MNDDIPPRQRRGRWAGVAAALMLAPAVISPPSAWLLAVLAAVTLAVAILAWPAGRISLAQAAGGAALLSSPRTAATSGSPAW
ncbi:hypothetical protein PQR15_15985 [Streptomyces lydicus]|nr:hypothetical protein [Streptomyces lydicus]